ncbi:MAG: hypothetical protein KC736_00675 [Candidatus Moranbacteria bacterium]|nr:hypothetical protein [Candidatus Moranbacteria bacterium]
MDKIFVCLMVVFCAVVFSGCASIENEPGPHSSDDSTSRHTSFRGRVTAAPLSHYSDLSRAHGGMTQETLDRIARNVHAVRDGVTNRWRDGGRVYAMVISYTSSGFGSLPCRTVGLSSHWSEQNQQVNTSFVACLSDGLWVVKEGSVRRITYE